MVKRLVANPKVGGSNSPATPQEKNLVISSRKDGSLGNPMGQQFYFAL